MKKILPKNTRFTHSKSQNYFVYLFTETQIDYAKHF